MNVTRLTCGALIAAVVVVTCGCETTAKSIQPPYTVYRSPSLLQNAPRRVLLMPVVSSTFDDGHAKLWYESLAGEIRATKRFDVVTTSIDVSCVQECLDWVERGQFSERNLAAVRDYYRVDAVLFVKQADYYPYTPPRMSVALSLVDARTGETIGAVDGTWNADDSCVNTLIKQYARDATLAKRFGNPELIEISPRHFGRFVAHELADSLSRLMQPPIESRAVAAGADSCVDLPITATNVPPQSLQPAESLPSPPPVAPVVDLPHPTTTHVVPSPQVMGRQQVRPARLVRIGGAKTYRERTR